MRRLSGIFPLHGAAHKKATKKQHEPSLVA